MRVCFYLRVMDKIKLSAGEKMSLMSEKPWGEAVCLHGKVFLWYFGEYKVFTCVCVLLFDMSGYILTQKKGQVEMLMMYIFCVWYVHEAGTAVQAGIWTFQLNFCQIAAQQPIDKVHLILLAALYWWLTTQMLVHLIHHWSLLWWKIHFHADNVERWYAKYDIGDQLN